MAREFSPESPKAVDTVSQGHGGAALQDAAEAFGAFYAAIARFAVGRVEAWADRRAEARAARLGARAVTDRRHRLARRARRGARI